MKYSPFFHLLLLFILTSCEKAAIPKNEIFIASPEDFTQELTTVSPSTEAGITLKL